jgi:hypothetical protein
MNEQTAVERIEMFWDKLTTEERQMFLQYLQAKGVRITDTDIRHKALE